MSQKTYALDSPITREITDGVLVAEKRLRRLYRTPQPIYFAGNADEIVCGGQRIFCPNCAVLILFLD